MIASIHIYNSLFRNIHDAADIVDNLIKLYQPRCISKTTKNYTHSCFARASDDGFNKRSNFNVSYLVPEVRRNSFQILRISFERCHQIYSDTTDEPRCPCQSHIGYTSEHYRELGLSGSSMRSSKKEDSRYRFCNVGIILRVKPCCYQRLVLLVVFR